MLNENVLKCLSIVSGGVFLFVFCPGDHQSLFLVIVNVSCTDLNEESQLRISESLVLALP